MVIEIKNSEQLIAEFIDIYNSLKKQLDGTNYNLFELINFVNLYRVDSIELFYDFINPNVSKLDIYMKKIGISKPLDPIKKLKLYSELVNRFYELMAFHLTSNVELENILNNGMSPMFKQTEFSEIYDVVLNLSENTQEQLFPFIKNKEHPMSDYHNYSYTVYLRKEGFSYGYSPEWVKILTNSNKLKNITDVVKYIRDICEKNNESEENILKVINLGIKYYEKYQNSKRYIVIFPLNLAENYMPLPTQKDEIDKICTSSDFEFYFDFYLTRIEEKIDEKSKQIIPNNMIIAIDEDIKEITTNLSKKNK